jgi:hypothetical protein
MFERSEFKVTKNKDKELIVSRKIVAGWRVPREEGRPSKRSPSSLGNSK